MAIRSPRSGRFLAVTLLVAATTTAAMAAPAAAAAAPRALPRARPPPAGARTDKVGVNGTAR
ncbi:hypothetical protein, partial [Actinoplanes sp. NPDC005259]|uniref:hypothetical protein n=1 Tax=Actinoplanes sp. NPDC005259 TaxID=3154674 RepID=UPI0033B3C682